MKSNMKLKHKLLIPNLSYVVMLGIVIFMFFSSKAMIKSLTEKQEKLSNQSTEIRDFAMDVRDFLDKSTTYDKVQGHYNDLKNTIDENSSEVNLENLWDKIEKIHRLDLLNDEIEKNIHKSTYDSIAISNGYIETVSNKLADEEKREEVSKLERLVIIGANISTTTNYELKVRFDKLKENIKEKDSVIEYADFLIGNAEKDMENLKGTPFYELPKKAKELIVAVKKLIIEYGNNAQKIIEAKTLFFNEIEKAVTHIDEINAEGNLLFFKQINLDFEIILGVVIAVSVFGIVFSVILSGKIAFSLNNVISSLNNASNQMDSASLQVASSSQQMAEGASEQASSLEEISSSLEEMSSMTKQSADNTSQAEKLMLEAKGLVENGKKAIDEVSTTISEIKTSSDQTEKILKTIDEIAFQTNLLALNAAVEAARAGEAGKGFAVVAEEVRNLAQRSAEAAKNTASLIEVSKKSSEKGVAVTDDASKAMDKIIDSASKVYSLTCEVSSASKEQAQGIEQINGAVSQMDKVTQSNASNSEESASASEELSGQAGELNNLVGDLVTIVEGNSSHNGNVNTLNNTNTYSRNEKFEKIPLRNRMSKNQLKELVVSKPKSSKRITPQEVIPLTDEELSDF